MQHNFSGLDIGILFAYALILIGMGIYYKRNCRTSEQFMVADRTIPAWAAGLAVMSAYTSSISYIATPGKAFDTNWNPIIFALCIPPVAWMVCKYAVPYYRKMKLISVYTFLEERLGCWARIYAALSFVLYMVGRVAVILYLVSLLLSQFLPTNAEYHTQTIISVILTIGVITIIYTLLGGMEAVVWTDVMQSIIMILGIAFCAYILSRDIFSGSEPMIKSAVENNKFSFGSWNLSLSTRTIWVMIIYGVTENLRNLLADQNYVQKYCSVPNERDAKKSIWLAMLIYIPLTAVFLYIGTALFAFYSQGNELIEAGIVKGDEVFPYFIATQLPAGLKGLIVAAIVAAAMSTVDSAMNCSATVLLLDFHKRFINPDIKEPSRILYLRIATVIWGLLGTGFAILMINAKSVLDVWWQISGIFGGGILGLFILSLLKVQLRLWQGIISVIASITVITWGTFARNLPESWQWAQCNIEPIIIGAMGTAALMIVSILFWWMGLHKK
jgi:SSS family solute:Na+ symporter